MLTEGKMSVHIGLRNVNVTFTSSPGKIFFLWRGGGKGPTMKDFVFKLFFFSTADGHYAQGGEGDSLTGHQIFLNFASTHNQGCIFLFGQKYEFLVDWGKNTMIY